MVVKIFLHNTINNKKELFNPIQPDVVKIYACGPTVYDRPHIGNARSIVVYDLLYRLFLKLYPKVIYVRNITDVDDKINASAKEKKITINQLTKEITELFHQDIKALNTLPPSFEPKATEHINEMIELINKLIINNHAYIANNHVLFDVNSFKDYGRLSNRKLEDLISGARIEIADYKKNPLDFVLWKPFDLDDDPSSIFDSPWGKGKPGWHIECSAMSSKYLGADFDIHGGGADLQFPHHENEIAQSCCANKGSFFANFWVHNGFVTVNGEKMSKSLKNFTTVFDLLNQGYSGLEIRLMLLSTHYRKPLDFKLKNLEDARITIEKFNKIINESLELFNQKIEFFCNQNDVDHQVVEYLADDLNFSKALANLHQQIKNIKKDSENLLLRKKLISTLDFLGFINI
jgi:cysteinyl-tRNA synthetase